VQRLLTPFTVASAAALMGLSLVAGVGAAGAKPAPAPTTTTTTVPPLDSRVFVVGDSVMLGAQSALGFRLGVSGWLVAHHETESLHTFEVPAIIAGARAAGGVGEVVVVSMGANDGSDPAQFSVWIDGVMASVPDVKRVYWVNMRHFSAWVPAANGVIEAAAFRWPTMRVLDWGARSQNEPGFVGGDGLHLTDSGKAALADLVGQALDQYRVERTPPPGPKVVPGSDVAQARVIRDDTGESSLVLWIVIGAAALLSIGAAVNLLGRSRSSV